jgi:hypothetical protein
VISTVEVPHPVEYLPTGDHGLLVAWTTIPPVFFLGGGITAEAAERAGQFLKERTVPRALICLEDGRAVLAELSEFKFDYRYDMTKGRFIDVSNVNGQAEEEEGDIADTDQEPADDGGQGVPGQVPEHD